MKTIYLIIAILFIIVVIIYFCMNIPVDKFLNISRIGYKFPVDAVITFRGEIFNSNSNREGYNYEIKYCLRAISKNMPWIRRIYILQNGPEVPSFFSENYLKNNVYLYSHLDVIPKKYLPTTNSDSIETFLTRLPGLSENFIYFNDDMFVRKPVSIDYFFTAKGIPKRIMFSRIYLKQNREDIIESPPAPGIWYPHVPIPYTKTEINEYINRYPKFIEYIRSIKSREDKFYEACHNIGLTFPCMQLHAGVDFMGKGVYNNDHLLSALDYYFYPFDLNSIELGTRKFFCLNDHSLGSLEERNINRNKLKKIMEKIFPEKSRAEI